ncbi:MAG: dihydrodipicolinate reductase [bacterium]|nr:dihydrodipicolinate reductase [bacterium]
MEEIKIIQYGCGKMSKYTMRYAIENGYKIVGAIDINPDLIGKDIGNVIGCDDVGVKITSVNDAESLFQSVKADVCIVTTMSLLNDVKDSLILCAKYGVNAITTCEEAFYPMNSNPHLTLEIDKIAKENNCTITGSGYQDAFWGNLISTLAGTTQRITKIKGSSSYNVEDYGIALAKAHGAGLTNEEFQRDVASADNISNEERQSLINKGEFLPSYMWNVNGWLCDKLGLHVKSQSQKCIPTFNDKEIYSKTLDMNITTDRATGMSAVVTTETQEGIILETECIGKVYGENDCDKNDWTVMGEPNTNLVITRPSTVELTCAAIVNRIPDVIASDSGFVPTSRMGELKYTVK